MNDLYQTILARRSVRRYAKRPLTGENLARVQAIISGVKPLVPDNRFEVLLRDVEPDENLVATLGAYGRIVSPPHYLVPYSVGEIHVLTDQGYRVEQIAVNLARMGIGSCFIGSLGREAEVRARFGLPETARIGAFLVFGYRTSRLAGRAFNASARWVVGATNKLPNENRPEDPLWFR